MSTYFSLNTVMVWYFQFIYWDFVATLLMCHVPLPVLACFPAFFLLSCVPALLLSLILPPHLSCISLTNPVFVMNISSFPVLLFPLLMLYSVANWKSVQVGSDLKAFKYIYLEKHWCSLQKGTWMVSLRTSKEKRRSRLQMHTLKDFYWAQINWMKVKH